MGVAGGGWRSYLSSFFFSWCFRAFPHLFRVVVCHTMLLLFLLGPDMVGMFSFVRASVLVLAPIDTWRGWRGGKGLARHVYVYMILDAWGFSVVCFCAWRCPFGTLLHNILGLHPYVYGAGML